MGSLERFIGVLIEHYAGKFPLWLAPVQVAVLCISEKFENYAAEIKNTLSEKGYRVELDARNDTIGYKIREATLQKVPYILVIGEKEQQTGTVAVRTNTGENIGPVPLQEFMDKLNSELI
jgi:threonyl-tRNA synthetase